MLVTDAWVLYAVGLWIAFCLAKLEVAIEGPNGWAAKLPTWRFAPKSIVLRLMLGARPITGYHVWFETSILSMLHAVYLFVPFSYAMEMQIFALFLFIAVCEDFLWFIVNPAYGIRKFKKDKISWHKDNWWIIAPRDYYVGLAFSALLFWGSLQ